MSIAVETVQDNARGSAVRLEIPGSRPSIPSVQVESTPRGRSVTVFLGEELPDTWQRVRVVLPDGYALDIFGTDWFWVDLKEPGTGKYLGSVHSGPRLVGES